MPPKKPSQTKAHKEGLFIKFKGDVPTKTTPLSDCLDIDGNIVNSLFEKASTLKSQRLSLTLPRVSLISNPIMLDDLDGQIPRYLKSSISLSSYEGASMRVSGKMDGNMILVTRCCGISAQHILGDSSSVQISLASNLVEISCSRDICHEYDKYSDDDLALVMFPSGVKTQNLMTPQLPPASLKKGSYNCMLVGHVPFDGNISRIDCLIIRETSTGKDEEVKDPGQKETILQNVHSKLTKLFSGHQHMIASIGNTETSSDHLQCHSCSIVSGSGSAVRFIEEKEVFSLPGDFDYSSLNEQNLYTDDSAIFHGVHIECLQEKEGKIQNLCITTKSHKFLFLYCSAIAITAMKMKEEQVFFTAKQHENACKFLIEAEYNLSKCYQSSKTEELLEYVGKIIKFLKLHTNI